MTPMPDQEAGEGLSARLSAMLRHQSSSAMVEPEHSMMHLAADEIDSLRSQLSDLQRRNGELEKELVEMLRCGVTGNPVGTDTWMIGYECPCANCQKYVAFQRSTDDRTAK